MAVKVGSFAKSTAAASVDQAITGVGFKARALILWTAGNTSEDTWQDNYLAAVGFAARNASDTITVGSLALASQDGQETTNTSGGAAAKALTIVQWGETVLAEADLKSFDADGFTLTWTTNDGAAYVIHYMALGGSEITAAYVKGWATGTSNTDVAVTGVGFQPAAVLHLMGRCTAAGAAAHAALDVGAMDSGGQWSMWWLSRDNQATGLGARHASTTMVLNSTVDNGGTDFSVALKSLDADGFTVTITEGPAASRLVYSLCLAGGSYDIGNFQMAASAGDQAITGVGFQPEGVLLASINYHQTTYMTSSGGLSVGASDGTNHHGSVLNDQWGLGVTTSNSASQDSSSYALLRERAGDQGTLDGTALIKSFGADGFTLTLAGWEGTLVQDYVGYFAFSGGAVATGRVCGPAVQTM